MPFTFQFYGIQYAITSFIFNDLIEFILKAFGIVWTLNDYSSDSVKLFTLFALLGMISFVLTIIFSIKLKESKIQTRVISIAGITGRYFLIWILLKYGLDKLFKYQFYLPEPNILYSKVGDLDKDILFWSSMGSSYTYNILIGILEIVPALLMIFKRTQLVGFIMAIVVFTHVLIINISFDISVKAFSTFLLFTASYLISPYFVKIWRFFTFHEVSKLEIQSGNSLPIQSKLLWKSFALVIIGFESFYPYLKSGNFNDDHASRPLYHGAYQVESIIKGTDTLSSHSANLERIFIHRDNYLIFQDTADQFEDFYFELNATHSKMSVIDYNQKIQNFDISYNPKTRILYLINKHLQIKCKALPWKTMALIQPIFHWTVD
jgi:hypothetical protein